MSTSIAAAPAVRIVGAGAVSEAGQRLISEIRRVAAEQPDRVVTECTYIAEMSEGVYGPSCLVGHGLVAMGIEPTLVYDHLYEEDRPEDWNEDKFDHCFAHIEGLEGISEAEVRWVQIAQTSQDGYESWASSVRTADVCAPLDETRV